MGISVAAVPGGPATQHASNRYVPCRAAKGKTLLAFMLSTAKNTKGLCRSAC